MSESLHASDQTDKHITTTRRWQQTDNLAKMQSGPILNTRVRTLPLTKLLTYDTSSTAEVKSSRVRLTRTVTWPPDSDRQTDRQTDRSADIWTVFALSAAKRPLLSLRCLMPPDSAAKAPTVSARSPNSKRYAVRQCYASLIRTPDENSDISNENCLSVSNRLCHSVTKYWQEKK
jgi:hypothetical protein